MQTSNACRGMQLRAGIYAFAFIPILPMIASAGIMLAPSSSGPTVTFILSLNDNGTGAFTRDSFAVYAVDSTADGNQGIVDFAVNIPGARTYAKIKTEVAAYGNYEDGTGPSNDVQIGFNGTRTASISRTQIHTTSLRLRTISI